MTDKPAPKRPLRLEYVDPGTLLLGAHPSNWRTHSAEQKAAFEGLLAEVGWADAVLFNEATGKLIDGHMRLGQAVANRLPVVPVLIGSWDAATELKILASRDTLGLMSGIDPKAWESVLREVDTGCTELMELFSDLSEEWGVIPADDKPASAPRAPRTADSNPDDDDDDDDPADGPDPTPDAPSAPTNAGSAPDNDNPGVPDVVFASDNEWDIPTLDLRMQADYPDYPVVIWGSQGRTRPMCGTWIMYSEDRRFTPLWKNPRAVLESRAVAIVEPNFSTHPQMPRYRVLWDIAKKRWLARYWQTQGLKVFVDLHVNEEHSTLNFLGVPKGWRAYATRIHHGDTSVLERKWSAASAHSETEDLVFLVYGGGAACKAICAARGWYWVPENSDSSRGK